LGYKIDIDEVENSEIYQAILKSNIKYADIVKDEVFNLDLIKQKAKEHVEQLDIGLDKPEIVDLIKKWGITENNAFHATYLADTGLKGIICLPYGFDSDDVLLHEFNHALGRHLIDRDGFKKYDCYNGFVKCSQWKRKSSDGRYIYNTEEQSLYNIFNEIVTEYLATRMVDEMKRDHKFINGFNSEHRCTYTLTMNHF